MSVVPEESVISRLINEGEYSHILERIFCYLDGTSLHSTSLVCKTWRNIILDQVLGSASNRKRLKEGWKKGVPASKRIKIGSESLCMVADEDKIVCGLGDGRIAVYNRATFSSVNMLMSNPDICISIDMDSRLLITGWWNGSIQLWCKQTFQQLTTINQNLGPVVACHLDPPIDQGSGLVKQMLYTTHRKGSVLRYALVVTRDNVSNKTQLVREPQLESFKLEHSESVTCSAIGPDHILVGSSDSKLYLWDKRRVSKLKSLEGHTNAIRCVTMKYPQALSGSKDKTAILWNLEEGTMMRTLQHSSDVRSVFMNNVIMITGDDFKDVYIWDVNTEPGGNPLRTLSGHTSAVHSLHCERFVLLSCDISGILIEKDFWDCVEAGPGMRILRCDIGVNTMVCDHLNVVVGLLNKKIEVYDRKSLQLVQTLEGHTDHVWSLDMNQSFIVSGSWDSSVRIWSRETGALLFLYIHPHGREISGVKIVKDKIIVTSLAGSLNVIEAYANNKSFRIHSFFPGEPDLGEIYSLACDKNYILTGHTLTNSSFKLWDVNNFSVKKVIKETSNQSIIWNIHLQYPLALVCRDNEILDLYNLELGECIKSLKHESKLLCAAIHEGKVISGCQYGQLVIWSLQTVLAVDRKTLGMSHSESRLYEHSAAVSNIYVDSQELITDDYDGIVILRNLRHYRRFNRLFKRAPQVDFGGVFEGLGD